MRATRGGKVNWSFLERLGADLMDWRGGQGTAVYGVGSSIFGAAMKKDKGRLPEWNATERAWKELEQVKRECDADGKQQLTGLQKRLCEARNTW